MRQPRLPGFSSGSVAETAMLNALREPRSARWQPPMPDTGHPSDTLHNKDHSP
jgi:hypothetical protein